MGSKKKNNKNSTLKKETKKNNIKENNIEIKKDINVSETKKNVVTKKNVNEQENSKGNKMIYIILAIICILVLIIYFVTKDNKNAIVDNEDYENYGDILDQNDALSIGTKKYMEFLWLVDGAFNDSRFNNHIYVNNMEVNKNILNFSCKYDDAKAWCKGENFEDAFRSVFSSNVTYRDVYSDGLAYDWYEKRNDGYYFENPTGCDAMRMSDTQTISLTKEEANKLTFKVQFTDNMKTGIYKGEHKIKREFILIREDNSWKVDKAYYHDLCFQDYYIPKDF